MIDGALVLPEVSVGMIEASATRSPCHAVHAKLVIDHRHRVHSHLAGADRMVGGLGVVPDPVEQFVIGAMFTPGAISSVAMSAMAGAVMMRRVIRIAASVTSRSSSAVRKLKRIAGGLFGASTSHECCRCSPSAGCS